MKNLFDWLAERTPQYKHIWAVCKQEIKECEEIKQNYNKLKQDITNKLKLIRKIRTHVNKLDKKDENVKEIKRLIKEVL